MCRTSSPIRNSRDLEHGVQPSINDIHHGRDEVKRVETVHETHRSDEESHPAQLAGFPFDPSLLTLTEQEREWALEIREAALSDPQLDIYLSDFMCANLAIAGKGDVGWALERAAKMEAMQREYNILGTYHEGAKDIKDLMHILPSGIMAFNYNPHSGHVVTVFDATVPLKKKCQRSKENSLTLYRGCYYLCYAQFPTFESMRQGNTAAFEFEGYKLGAGMCEIKEAAKLVKATQGTFPTVNREVRFYHTNKLAFLLIQLVKPFIPKETKDRLMVGCTFKGGRLDNYYKARHPSLKVADELTLKHIYGALMVRMESERVFKL